MLALGNVNIRGNARDEDVSLALRVDQVAQVAGVHDVEYAVALMTFFFRGREPTIFSSSSTVLIL